MALGYVATPHPLGALHGLFTLAREAAAVIGVKPSDSKITEEHRARLEYRALFPDGAPKILD